MVVEAFVLLSVLLLFFLSSIHLSLLLSFFAPLLPSKRSGSPSCLLKWTVNPMVLSLWCCSQSFLQSRSSRHWAPECNSMSYSAGAAGEGAGTSQWSQWNSCCCKPDRYGMFGNFQLVYLEKKNKTLVNYRPCLPYTWVSVRSFCFLGLNLMKALGILGTMV